MGHEEAPNVLALAYEAIAGGAKTEPEVVTQTGLAAAAVATAVDSLVASGKVGGKLEGERIVFRLPGKRKRAEDVHALRLRFGHGAECEGAGKDADTTVRVDDVTCRACLRRIVEFPQLQVAYRIAERKGSSRVG